MTHCRSFSCQGQLEASKLAIHRWTLFLESKQIDIHERNGSEGHKLTILEDGSPDICQYCKNQRSFELAYIQCNTLWLNPFQSEGACYSDT